MPPHREETEVRLSRELGLMDATMLGVGALLGGGIFVLVGHAAGLAGPAVVLAFALNALLTLPMMAVYAELGSAFEDAGGGYLWVREALAQPWGFLSGWVGWFSHAVACALYSIAAAEFTTWLLRIVGWNIVPEVVFAFDVGPLTLSIAGVKLLAVAFAAAFIGINYLGAKAGIRTENAITWVVLCVIAFYVFFALRAIAADPAAAASNFHEFAPRGLGGIFLAMALTFIAFEGYEIIAQSSEEVRDPRRTVPRAMWASLFIVAPLYLVVVFVSLGAIVPSEGARSWQILAEGQTLALVEAADRFVPYGQYVLLAAALLTNLTALNATIFSSSRMAFAMGRDGNLPKKFGDVHRVRRTPHRALLASGAIIITMALLLPLVEVAAAATVMFLLLFLLVTLSYVKLRKTLSIETFGWRAPFFPTLPIAAVAGQIFIGYYIFRLAPVAWFVTIGWIALGLLAFYVYLAPRERAHRELKARESIAHEKEHEERKDYRILVPIVNPANAEALADVASSIAAALDGEVHFLYVVQVPEVTPLSEGRNYVPQAREVLERAENAVAGRAPVHTLIRIGHSVSQAIHDTAVEKGASLLLMGWRGGGPGRLHEFLHGSLVQTLSEYPPCDFAVYKIRDVRPVRRVLIPTHGGQHAPLSIKLGTAIAKANDAEAVLYHAMPPEAGDEAARRARGRALLRNYGLPGATSRMLLEREEDVVAAVRKHARDADIVFVGATTQPGWVNYVFGHKTEQIADQVDANVLLVKAHPGPAAHRARMFTRRFRAFQRYLRPD